MCVKVILWKGIHCKKSYESSHRNLLFFLLEIVLDSLSSAI